MNYKVNIWQDDTLKREIVYSAENDIQAIQMASAATPDGCRATYEQMEEKCPTEKEPMVQKEEDLLQKAS